MNSISFHRQHAFRLLTVVALASLAGTACSEGDTSTVPRGPSAGPAVLQRSAISDRSGTVWVTNRAHNDITAFDGRTGAAIVTIPVGANPIDIVAPRDTRKIYVSNEDSNTVSVISKESLTLLGDVPMPTRNGKPHHLVQSPDGRFVYVAEFGSHRVAVIDTVTDTVVREYDAGASGAKTHAVGVSPDGWTLYAVNSGANEIVALEASTGDRRWSLNVGQNPSEILVTRAGIIGYVSIRGENSVKVLDLQSGAVVGEVRVGPEPDTMQLTNDGRILVVALRGTPAYVALVDTNDYTSVRWTQLDGTTTGHQWLSSDGTHTFVAVEGHRAGIGVVDNQTGEAVAMYSYPVVSGATAPTRPHGVFYDVDRLTPSPR